MSSNIDINQNPIKLAIPEYSTKNGISTSTVRNWIRSGKVEWEKVKGKYLEYLKYIKYLTQKFTQYLGLAASHMKPRRKVLGKP